MQSVWYEKLICYGCLSAVVFRKKQRRQYSLNRFFAIDYIGLDSKPGLQNLVGRREKVVFAETVKKYDRKFKVKTTFTIKLN